MLKFGVIAEGVTDFRVIQSILLGYFEDEEDEHLSEEAWSVS